MSWTRAGERPRHAGLGARGAWQVRPAAGTGPGRSSGGPPAPSCAKAPRGPRRAPAPRPGVVSASTRPDAQRSRHLPPARPVPSPPGFCPEARTDHRARKHGGLFVTALRSHRFQTEPHEQLRTTQRCAALSDVTTGLPATLPQAGPPAYSCLREHHSASARVCKRSPNYLTPSGKPGMSGASANPPFKRARTATAGGPAPAPHARAHSGPPSAGRVSSPHLTPAPTLRGGDSDA